MEERIIVSLTTWSKRIQNIPTVLDTIFAQTLPPDLVVLNLAYDEAVPDNVQQYIDQHHIEVNRVPDTKVYKKILPTLHKYPNDCIIGIDDDWLYPEGMIEDFMEVHSRYPDNPISGNHIVLTEMQCHCGCASLTKACYFGHFLDAIDDDVIKNCFAEDFVYTFMETKAGHPYVRTKHQYFINMKPFNEVEPYSVDGKDNVEQTFAYLKKRFGPIDNNVFKGYIADESIANLINEIHQNLVKRHEVLTNTTTYKFALKLQRLLRFLRIR